MDETDGPFAGIIRNCITAADEEELRNCPFTVEFENFPESFASQSRTIPNYHVTDSVSKIENFQTPLEHQYSQTCISGSDDRRRNTSTAVDLPANVSSGEDTAAGYRDGTEDQVRVDLGKDNDNLGFTKPREVTVDGCHGGDGVERIDGVEYSEGGMGEPLRKRIRICEKKLRMQSSITDLEGDEIVRDEVVDDSRMKRNVDFAVTESKDGENLVVIGKKHANGLEERCTAGVEGSMRGRRELPFWMRGGENSVEVEDVGRKAMKKGRFKDIIEVAMEVFEKKTSESTDADFFETAKRRDMLFPRPRWWQPELFVD